MVKSATYPKMISFDRENTTAKSADLAARPIPNITTIKRELIQDVFTHNVEAGRTREADAMTNTINAIYLPNSSLIFSNRFTAAYFGTIESLLTGKVK